MIDDASYFVSSFLENVVDGRPSGTGLIGSVVSVGGFHTDHDSPPLTGPVGMVGGELFVETPYVFYLILFVVGQGDRPLPGGQGGPHGLSEPSPLRIVAPGHVARGPLGRTFDGHLVGLGCLPRTGRHVVAGVQRHGEHEIIYKITNIVKVRGNTNKIR